MDRKLSFMSPLKSKINHDECKFYLRCVVKYKYELHNKTQLTMR